jgi:2'-5' RNA ligase
VGKRLFLAVDIDDATRTQVGRIASGLREALDTHTKLSWVRPERMHLTLHFLGNVDDAFEERLRETLSAPIAVAPFDVTFDGLGMFPERGSPRVLWLGVAEGLEPLRRLHAALVGLDVFEGLDLSRAVPERTADSFTPHLTLARVRPSTRARDALRALEGRDRVTRSTLTGITRIQAFAGPSRIDRVTLYESRLSPAGPTYVRLAEAPLTRSD